MADALDYGDTVPGAVGPTSVGGAPLSGGDSSDYSMSDFLGPAAGLAGLGVLLGRGEPQLPEQFRQAEAMVPGLQKNASTLFGEGQNLYTDAQKAIQMARAGELTIPQRAELNQYKTGLQNVANQTFASMGRSMTSDTSAINTQAQIDAQVNAMAQKEIQTTLQIGFGELSAASSFTNESLGFSKAASDILLAAGKAQLDQDKAYSDQLTQAFASVTKLFMAAAV